MVFVVRDADKSPLYRESRRPVPKGATACGKLVHEQPGWRRKTFGADVPFIVFGKPTPRRNLPALMQSSRRMAGSPSLGRYSRQQSPDFRLVLVRPLRRSRSGERINRLRNERRKFVPECRRPRDSDSAADLTQFVVWFRQEWLEVYLKPLTRRDNIARDSDRLRTRLPLRERNFRNWRLVGHVIAAVPPLRSLHPLMRELTTSQRSRLMTRKISSLAPTKPEIAALLARIAQRTHALG